jgi:hypothetical protein
MTFNQIARAAWRHFNREADWKTLAEELGVTPEFLEAECKKAQGDFITPPWVNTFIWIGAGGPFAITPP